MKEYLSSWLPSASGKKTSKDVHVKVKSLKLEGVKNGGGDEKERIVIVVMKWKGPNNNNNNKSKLLLLPFHSKCQKNYTSHKLLKKGAVDIEWDEEFENIFIGSKDNNNKKKKSIFSSRHVSFKILYGEDAKARTKLVEMGKVSMNIAEVVSSAIDYEIEKKLPVTLQIDEVVSQATFSVCMSFAGVRSSVDGIVPNSAELDYEQAVSELARSPTFSEHKIHKVDPVNSATRCNSDLKAKLWSTKRWSFAFSKRRRESLIQKSTDDEEIQLSNSHNNCTTSWEVKELVSRDGQTKLKANVFFASFDQRSEKAAGESACAALVAVIAHWLQSNQDYMPTTSQFDRLIAEGSSEWRKLCNNDVYTNSFPDNHFDLETVLKAELRPVNILHNKSFTGIFSPEKFENLKGAMSFNDIWEEISSDITEDFDQRIYIVSWNDHFFVLKADTDAHYIIDSLGERLFEGCNQAYILKFDDSTLMYGKAAKEETNSKEMTEAEEDKDKEESEGIICKGKECCKEFIKRFLAAIPIRELEEQEKNGSVSTFSLLQRLQIDFHYCSSSSSSSMASPTSSLFSSDE